MITKNKIMNNLCDKYCICCSSTFFIQILQSGLGSSGDFGVSPIPIPQ